EAPKLAPEAAGPPPGEEARQAERRDAPGAKDRRRRQDGDQPAGQEGRPAGTRRQGATGALGARRWTEPDEEERAGPADDGRADQGLPRKPFREARHGRRLQTEHEDDGGHAVGSAAGVAHDRKRTLARPSPAEAITRVGETVEVEPPGEPRPERDQQH